MLTFMGEILRVLEPQKVAPKAKRDQDQNQAPREGFARDSDRVHSEGIGNYHKFKDGAKLWFSSVLLNLKVCSGCF